MINRAEQFLFETFSRTARARRIVEQAGFDSQYLGLEIGIGGQSVVYEWNDPLTFGYDVVAKIARPETPITKAWELPRDAALVDMVATPTWSHLLTRTHITNHSHLVFQKKMSGVSPVISSNTAEDITIQTLREAAELNRNLARAYSASFDFVHAARSVLRHGVEGTKVGNLMYTLDGKCLQVMDPGLLHFDGRVSDPYYQALAVGNWAAAKFQNAVFKKYLGIELM